VKANTAVPGATGPGVTRAGHLLVDLVNSVSRRKTPKASLSILGFAEVGDAGTRRHDTGREDR
jgi:hypothetical protein